MVANEGRQDQGPRDGGGMAGDGDRRRDVPQEQRPGDSQGGTSARLFDTERERAAGRLADVSCVVREAMEKLGGETVVSRLAGRMADTIDRAGEYIHGAEPKDLLRDTRDFARRRPETFMGGAFLAGAILGRFLRSHPDQDRPEHEDRSEMDIDRERMAENEFRNETTSGTMETTPGEEVGRGY